MKTFALLLLLSLSAGCSSEPDQMELKQPKIVRFSNVYEMDFEEQEKDHKRLEELQQEALEINEDDSILDIIDKATGGMK